MLLYVLPARRSQAMTAWCAAEYSIYWGLPTSKDESRRSQIYNLYLFGMPLSLCGLGTFDLPKWLYTHRLPNAHIWFNESCIVWDCTNGLKVRNSVIRNSPSYSSRHSLSESCPNLEPPFTAYILCMNRDCPNNSPSFRDFMRNKSWGTLKSE